MREKMREKNGAAETLGRTLAGQVLKVLEGNVLSLDELCAGLGIPVRAAHEKMTREQSVLLNVLTSLRLPVEDGNGNTVIEPLIHLASPVSSRVGTEWKYYLASDAESLAAQGKLGEPYTPTPMSRIAHEEGIADYGGRAPLKRRRT